MLKIVNMKISSFLPRMLKLGRILNVKIELAKLRIRFGSEGFPSDLYVTPGVQVAITDGGCAFFGAGCSIDRNATILIKNGELVVGPSSYIGIGSVIVARESIHIGRDVLIAEYVTIRDQDHVFGGSKSTAKSGFKSSPVVIGDNVWLGAKVTVTRGVSIGNNSIIGANSVVTRDIPANVVAAGIPARVIRKLQLDDRSTEISA